MPGGDRTGPAGRGPMTGRGRGGGFSRGGGFGRGGRRGLGGGFALGPGGECICPNCGYREPHKLGVSCYNKKCPKCGTNMTRE